MNLILDIGNTKIKLAVFSVDEILLLDSFEEANLASLEKILSEFPLIENSIISSTRKRPVDLKNYLDEKLKKCIILDHTTSLPIVNKYKSPKTLGYDRIANVTAANSRFPDTNVLVIDTGTAITYDFISSKGEFLGGNISPGAEMRAHSLNKFTANLPLVNLHSNSHLLSNNTEEALVSGVVNGILFEMEGYIGQVKALYPDLKIILTGGDSKLFDKKLKNHIFVDSNLNLFGLNRILHYNVS
ncbi:MAG: type III pantothenate kinase [Bacteroidales bacterium]|nr:type III pantothenate kinase [Bacteroidales bacterium]MCF8390839.1 type III pantothenate kinase [Bacteroidales bacterium]